jgi:hypothetical protein
MNRDEMSSDRDLPRHRPDAPEDELSDRDGARDRAASDRPAEKKRRKKKRKKKKLPLRPALDDKGIERPRFLLAFPHDPKLDRLVAAFEAGDYRTVRGEAPELADQADDPRVRDAALELWRRIEPDPLLRYLLFASLGLLLFLLIYFYVHRP